MPGRAARPNNENLGRNQKPAGETHFCNLSHEEWDPSIQAVLTALLLPDRSAHGPGRLVWKGSGEKF